MSPRTQVLDKAESEAEIAVHICHWALRRYGQWALERKEDGVSERLGMRQLRESTLERQDVVIFGIDRPESRPNRTVRILNDV